MKNHVVSLVRPLAAVALGTLLAGSRRASAADLTVDQAYGNNPYTQSSGATYGNLIVGQLTQGAYTQNDGVLVNVSGTVTIGQFQSSSGTYDLGTNDASGSNSAFLQADSLVVGAGGQGVFTQHSGTVVTRTVSLQTASSSSGGAYYLGGGSLNTTQIGQNTGTASSGTFYFFGGTLTALADNSTFMQGLAAAYVYDTATIDSGAYNVTIGQALQTYGYGGDNGLTKRGSGTLTLTGANTYTGPTTISAGVLNAGSAGAMGNGGRISFAGGILQYSAASAGLDFSARFSTAANQAISLDTNGQNVTVASKLVGAGTSLTKLGVGTLTVSGANTYTGGTTLAGGTLNAGSAGALGSSGALSFQGGTLQYSAASAGMDFSARFSTAANQAISLDTNGQNVTVGYGFGGSGTSLTKLGGGTLTINGGNTYTGATNLNAGTVVVDNPGALGSGGAIVFNGGTLRYGNTSHSDAKYNAADYSARFSQAADQFFSIDTNGHSIVYNGTLAGSGGNLNKLGAGTLTLNGANTYTGETQIKAGTLLVANTSGSGTGTGRVQVVNGATLGGNGRVAGRVDLNGGATLAPGLAGPGQLSLGNDLNFNSGSTLAVELGGTMAGSGYDQVLVAGRLVLGNSTLSVSVVNGFTLAVNQSFDLLVDGGTGLVSGTFANATAGALYTDSRGDTFAVSYTANADGGTVANDVRLTVVSVVPEPSTWALLGLSVVGLSVASLRRRRAGIV